jgi:SAM-dependent methyltransferase
LFGLDVPGYDSIRPEYPSAVYERLQEVCGLAPGTGTLEIGAGSGLATRELIALGANPVTAIEPDQALADQLRQVVELTETRVDIHVASVEEFTLPDDTFDLAVAATSFHWVDPSVGLAKVRSALRPGGAWAMWWNVFGDPDRDDPSRCDAQSHGSATSEPFGWGVREAAVFAGYRGADRGAVRGRI